MKFAVIWLDGYTEHKSEDHDFETIKSWFHKDEPTLRILSKLKQFQQHLHGDMSGNVLFIRLY